MIAEDTRFLNGSCHHLDQLPRRCQRDRNSSPCRQDNHPRDPSKEPSSTGSGENGDAKDGTRGANHNTNNGNGVMCSRRRCKALSITRSNHKRGITSISKTEEEGLGLLRLHESISSTTTRTMTEESSTSVDINELVRPSWPTIHTFLLVGFLFLLFDSHRIHPCFHFWLLQTRPLSHTHDSSAGGCIVRQESLFRCEDGYNSLILQCELELGSSCNYSSFACDAAENSPNDTTTTTATTQDSCHKNQQYQDNKDSSLASSTADEALVHIEIGAIRAPLRRGSDIIQAVARDMCLPAICTGCSADLFCIADALFIICPSCQSISPAEECYTNHTNLLLLAAEDNNDTDTACRNRHGVALGFTYETLFQIQSDLAAEEKKTGVHLRRRGTC